MPTYDYDCDRCGHFSEGRPMAEFALPQPCPACGDPGAPRLDQSRDRRGARRDCPSTPFRSHPAAAVAARTPAVLRRSGLRRREQTPAQTIEADRRPDDLDDQRTGNSTRVQVIRGSAATRTDCRGKRQSSELQPALLIGKIGRHDGGNAHEARNVAHRDPTEAPPIAAPVGHAC